MRLRYAILAACCLVTAPVAAQTLTIALKADIRGTNPGVNRDDDTDVVTLHMVEGLVAYKEGGTVGAMLAKSIEMSPDGLNYVFELRDGLTFHNGAKVSAEDVVWSWNRYMDPATKWRCLADFDGRNGLKVESVKSLSANKVEMRIDQPSALFLVNLARTDCGSAAVIHKDSLNPDGSWKAPVGTGPFKLSEWRKGQEIVLTRFDDYKPLPGGLDGMAGGKKPLVEKVRFLVVPDTAAVKAALLAGQLDIAEILSSDVKELKEAKNLKVFNTTTAGRNALIFQANDPLFKVQRVREALATAIDYKQLAGVIDENLKPNNSTIHLTSPYYSDTQKSGFKYDPERAKKLLAEAGYKGQPVTITTNNRNTVPSFKIAVVLQSMFEAVGVPTKIDVVDWGTHMDKFLKGNYQMMVHSYSPRLDPALSFEHFMGDKTAEPRKVWDDKAALDQLDRASRIDDEKTRGNIFDELHKRMIDDVPLVMLFNRIEPWAMNSRIDGFMPWESRIRAWGVTARN